MRGSRITSTVAFLTAFMLTSLPAGAAQGDVALASTTADGVKGDGINRFPDLSDDGTKVAFFSFATNLDPGDTDADSDVYVKDLVTGELILASTSSAGLKGNGASFRPTLSADGTKVAFFSTSTDLDPKDDDAADDVYVKDLESGKLTLVSTNSEGVKGIGGSHTPAISADGTKVAFVSFATNFGSDAAVGQIFVKDLTTGVLSLASSSAGGESGNSSSLSPAISADGTKVGFHSNASNLTPSDQDFIPDVLVKDLTSGSIALASVNAGGVKGNDTSASPALSADGTTVVFRSGASNLVSEDFDAADDIYVKDLSTGELILVSTSTDGSKSNSGSFFPDITNGGTRVAFESFATDLDPDDQDEDPDIYVKDLSTGILTLASRNDAGEKGNFGSVNAALSGDGGKIGFVSSATNLDPADGDTIPDVYVKDLDSTNTEPVAVDITAKRKKGRSPAAFYTVTIKSDEDFDATQVDPDTVCFGDADHPDERDCTEMHGVAHIKDADRDGDLDMQLHFEAAETGIDRGDTTACLTGATVDGTPVQGCATITGRPR